MAPMLLRAFLFCLGLFLLFRGLTGLWLWASIRSRQAEARTLKEQAKEVKKSLKDKKSLKKNKKQVKEFLDG